MPMILKIFLIVIMLLFICLIVDSIRKQRLLLKYSLLWLFTTIFMIINVIFPQLLIFLCNILKIEVLSNMVFLFGIVILLMLTFALTVIVSNQKNKITILTEEIAILDRKIRGERNE